MLSSCYFSSWWPSSYSSESQLIISWWLWLYLCLSSLLIMVHLQFSFHAQKKIFDTWHLLGIKDDFKKEEMWELKIWKLILIKLPTVVCALGWLCVLKMLSKWQVKKCEWNFPRWGRWRGELVCGKGAFISYIESLKKNLLFMESRDPHCDLRMELYCESDRK